MNGAENNKFQPVFFSRLNALFNPISMVKHQGTVIKGVTIGLV